MGSRLLTGFVADEVQVAQSFAHWYVNPEQMNPPISHFVWSIGLSGYIIFVYIRIIFIIYIDIIDISSITSNNSKF